MTILEIIHQYRQTENVFKKYEKVTGNCLMCTALFESIQAVSEKYNLNLGKLLEELDSAAQ